MGKLFVYGQSLLQLQTCRAAATSCRLCCPPRDLPLARIQPLKAILGAYGAHHAQPQGGSKGVEKHCDGLLLSVRDAEDKNAEQGGGKRGKCEIPRVKCHHMSGTVRVHA